MEMKLKQGQMLQLEDHLVDPPVISVLCTQDIQGIASMVRTIADKGKFTSFYLSFLAYERDYENKGPHILQGMKNDLLALRSPKKTLVLISGLPIKIIQSDFIGLLQLIHQENTSMHFVIIENKEEVCNEIKRKLSSQLS